MDVGSAANKVKMVSDDQSITDTDLNMPQVHADGVLDCPLSCPKYRSDTDCSRATI